MIYVYQNVFFSSTPECFLSHSILETFPKKKKMRKKIWMAVRLEDLGVTIKVLHGLMESDSVSLMPNIKPKS